jgi:hypothetical protein
MKSVECNVHSSKKEKTSLRTQFFRYHKEAIKNPSCSGTDSTFKQVVFIQCPPVPDSRPIAPWKPEPIWSQKGGFNTTDTLHY